MVMSSLTFPGDLFAEVDELQRQIERVFAPRYPSSSIRAVGRGAFPAVNIGTTPDAIEVYAFAPGLDPSSLEVTVDRGLLTIAGNRAKSVEPGKNGNVYAQERPSGSFRRTVSLPDDADPAKPASGRQPPPRADSKRPDRGAAAAADPPPAAARRSANRRR